MQYIPDGDVAWAVVDWLEVDIKLGNISFVTGSNIMFPILIINLALSPRS